MKTFAYLFAASLALGAVPALAQTPTQPRDVGNMAYPAPLPQGNLSTTTPGKTKDTSSSAYPAPLAQGTVGSSVARARARTPTDTGSMAYPAPLPQGNVGTIKTK